MEQEIEAKTKQRQTAKEMRMRDLRQQLLKAKVQLKSELETNQDLNEKHNTLVMQESHQAEQLTVLEEQTTKLSKEVVDYERATRQQEDNVKMQRAYQQLQSLNDLTELTCLALKVNEQLQRAKKNQQQMQ